MTDTPTTPDTEAQFEARLREHLQPYLDMLPEADEGEIVPSIMHVVGPVLAERDTHRDRADAHEAMGDELRETNEKLRTKLQAPCGTCHPCNNWTAEEWRQDGRTPPSPWQWDETRADNERLRGELADVERIMVRDHQQAARATQGRDGARDLAMRALHRIDDALEPHQPYTEGAQTFCLYDNYLWPCPTYVALAEPTTDSTEED